MAISWLSAVGIAWDIGGAVALGRSVFFMSREKAKRQARSSHGASPAALRGITELRLDTRFGLGLLIVGFTLQLLAAGGVVAPYQVGLVLLVFLGSAWWYFLHNYSYWLVKETMGLAAGMGISEEIWRRHFDDVPELHWKRICFNEGIDFAAGRDR